MRSVILSVTALSIASILALADTPTEPNQKTAKADTAPGIVPVASDGKALNLDFEDEVTKSTVITKDGAVVSDAVNKLLNPGGQA